MSDTPRTDDGEYFIDGDRGIIDSGLGRQLERELNEAKNCIKRLEDIIKRAATRFFADGSDGQTAVDMLKILYEAREAKP